MKAMRSFCCAFAVTVIASFPFSVEAVPVDLAGGVSSHGVTLSGALHADFSGGVLTLNSSAPLSTLSIDGIAHPGEHVSKAIQYFDYDRDQVVIQVDFNLAP